MNVAIWQEGSAPVYREKSLSDGSKLPLKATFGCAAGYSASSVARPEKNKSKSVALNERNWQDERAEQFAK